MSSHIKSLRVKKSLCRPYASALLQLMEEGSKDARETMARDIKTLEQLCKESKDMVLVSSDPTLPYDKKANIFSAIQAQLSLGAIMKGFLCLLGQNHRLFLLPHILETYQELWHAKHNIKKVEFSTPIPLDEARKNLLKAKLKKHLKGDVLLCLKEDKSLLGGFLLRMDGLLLDASLKAKLDHLKKTSITYINHKNKTLQG